MPENRTYVYYHQFKLILAPPYSLWLGLWPHIAVEIENIDLWQMWHIGFASSGELWIKNWCWWSLVIVFLTMLGSLEMVITLRLGYFKGETKCDGVWHESPICDKCDAPVFKKSIYAMK